MNRPRHGWLLLLAATAIAGMLALAVWSPRFAGALTGVAGAVAAIAAAAAARESRQTARDAREALGRTILPAINPDVHAARGGVIGRIMNAGPFDALDVTVEWTMRDGRRARAQTQTLQAWSPNLGPGSDISLGILLPGLTRVDEALTGIERVTVRFHDTRRLCQWEESWHPIRDPLDQRHLGPPAWEKLHQHQL